MKYNDLWEKYRSWCSANLHSLNMSSRKFHSIFKREVVKAINRELGCDTISIYANEEAKKNHHSNGVDVYKLHDTKVFEHFFPEGITFSFNENDE